MISKKKKTLIFFYGFLIVLTIVNILQGRYTELILDESYYWYFSRNLNWGYFDHPPMVAFLIKLSYTVFQNELGVRFFSSVMFSGTVFFLWKIIESKEKYKEVLLFAILVSSVAIFNVYGFFMLPDTPLIFFSAFFLYSYKNFLAIKKWLFVLGLAISMAGMMYSKYHASIFIVCILISNVKLLTNFRFWVAGLTAILLYSPHLFWLYETNFESLIYHLFDRANSTYKINYTLDYILSFLVVPGVSFPFLFWALFKEKNNSLFYKSLKAVTYGIFIFFLLSSFNRRTQAQWTILATLPLIILAFSYALKHPKFKKGLLITSFISLSAIVFLRFALIFEDISPITYESHGNKKWTNELKRIARDKPVVFENSYTESSMYQFYTGNEAMSFNAIDFRRNQYDIDTSEYKFQHKNVIYISARKEVDSLFGYKRKFRNKKWRGIYIDDFESWRKLNVNIDPEKLNGDTFTLEIKNPYEEEIPLKKLKFFILTLNEKKVVLDTINVSIAEHKIPETVIPKKGAINVSATLLDSNKMKRKDAVYMRATIRENNLPMGFQGIPVKFK